MGFTRKQLETMQSRVRGGMAGQTESDALTHPPLISESDCILGIDPSLRGTGFGVIKTVRPGPVAVEFGTVRCPREWPRTRCLASIAERIDDVIRKHKPVICVVEGLFFAQNIKTAIIMGEARGAALSAVARSGLPVYEIATRKVKQALVGYGAAQKSAVANMIQRLLALPEQPEADAADALALAVTFLHEQNRYRLQQPKQI